MIHDQYTMQTLTRDIEFVVLMEMERQNIWVKTKNDFCAGQWWHTPLIPALGRQRQADFWVRGQPGLQREFQDSQGYTEKRMTILPSEWDDEKPLPIPRVCLQPCGHGLHAHDFRWQLLLILLKMFVWGYYLKKNTAGGLPCRPMPRYSPGKSRHATDLV